MAWLLAVNHKRTLQLVSFAQGHQCHHLQRKHPTSYSYNYPQQGRLVRVALGTCKRASMVVFCFGVNLA